MAEREAKLLTPEEISEGIPAFIDLVEAHFAAQCLHAVVKLGVPNVLGNRTMNAEDLAKELPGGSVRPEALQRCLRILALKGVFVESKAGEGPGICSFAYSLSNQGALLQTGVPGQPSLAFGVMHHLEAPQWGAWGEIPDYVAGNKAQSPWEACNGDKVFAYYAQHRESERVFHEHMKLVSQGELPIILEHGGWDDLSGKRVVDVGGNKGVVMGAVKAKFPSLTCATFDLPGVVENAGPPPEGVVLIPGDVFDVATVPEADVFFMKHFLHDFDDQGAAAILKNCCAKLPVGGQVRLADALLPEPGQAAPGLKAMHASAIHMDVHMLTINGKERTRAQFAALAEAAGLHLAEIREIPYKSTQLIIMEKQA